MITVLIKSLTTDQNVRDASMTKALCSRLWYPIVRQGALAVLSHMLLSFQHSPEAFHLVVPHVVPLVQSLNTDGLPTSQAFLLQFIELIHCMMYQYSGFPDLYDHILEAIKRAFLLVFLRLSEEEKTLHVLQSAKPNVAPLVDAIRTGPTSPTSSEDHKDSHLVEAESQCANDGRTLIERMFGGKLITGIRCMQCNCISEKEEPFTDLSLAFCPSASSQGSPKADRPSEEARVLCQGSVNGGSEAPESGLGSSLATNIQYEPVTNEPPLSVPDLVNYFLAPEILDEDNAYFCEKCISLQRAERTMKVVSAPEYLILTLLRFSYDAKSHIRKKILDNVVIPPALRLPVHASSLPVEWSSATSSPLQVDSPESSENLAKKLKPSQGEEEEEETKLMIDEAQKMNRGRETSVQSVPYMLSSVVVHSGISSESGHYYSYGRNINGADGTQHPAGLSSIKEDSVNNQGACSLCTSEQVDTFPNSGLEARDWLLFNDSRVTFTSLQSVQNITNRNRSSVLGPKLCRPLLPHAHSGQTVQMTTTHQGAVAHLEEEEEEEEASTPLADWSSEMK
ncbi:hypothetical protein GOODEAATRI_006376 [Goodea atripinnis]|uniref:USP domain-containing protein n=1 Tax=Goodea atripinnis TaxID=208336 RepID=A0ABV0PBS7_9TELE